MSSEDRKHRSHLPIPDPERLRLEDDRGFKQEG
jgi:hypothetical protein